MPRTQFNTRQYGDESIERDDLHIANDARSVIAKLIASTGISIISSIDTDGTTPVATGTGDVTIGLNISFTDGRYILNQTSQQTSSNFNISGSGVIGTTLQIGQIDAYATSSSTTKVLVSDNGVVKYRTAAQIIIDGGAQSISTITFRVGDATYPADGATTYQNNLFINKTIFLYREGERSYSPLDHTFDSTTGTITFGIELKINERIAIDIIDKLTSGGGISYTFQNSIIESGGVVNLVNDATSPGASKYYGTNSSSIKGWFNLPSPSSIYTFNSSLVETSGVVTLLGDQNTPGNNKLYGTDSSGVKGWYPQTITGSALVLQQYTTGATVTISQANSWLIVNPSATVSSLTITLPASPNNCEEIIISFGGTINSGTVITNLVISPNTSQTIVQASVPSSVDAGETISYRYNSSLSKWFRQ